MIYYKNMDNHKLGEWTESEKLAKLLGYPFSIPKEQAEYGYDEQLYEKGFAPKLGLQQAKSQKLAELKAYHEAQLSQSKIQSSVGFKIDANDKAASDLQGLSNLMTQTGMASIDTFRDATNALQTVTVAQVNTMENEVLRNEQVLRAKKEYVAGLINAKQTADEVEAVGIPTEYAKDVTVSFPEITEDMQPSTGGINIKTDGAKIAKALEWIGGTPQALNSGALQGLYTANFGTSETAVQMLGTGFKSYVHEFTGTGDVVQMLPNITNEDDSMLVLIRNSKTTGSVILNPGGTSDKIDGKLAYTLRPNHAVLMTSVKAKLRWVILNETRINENNKLFYREITAPITLPTDRSRIDLAVQDGATGTITQALPDLNAVPDDIQLQVINLTTGGGVIDLVPYAGQTVNGASSYTVDEQTDVIFIKDGLDWFLWFSEDMRKSTGGSVTVDGSNINAITAQYPVQLQVNADTNNLNIGIDPVALTSTKDVGIYYALNQPVEIIGRGLNAIHEGKVFCDMPIVGENAFFSVDRNNKGYTVQDYTNYDPSQTGGLLCAVEVEIPFDGNAPDDLNVGLHLWKHAQGTDTRDVSLTDYMGRVLSVHKNYKAGEEIGTLYAYGKFYVKQMETIGISIMHDAVSDALKIKGRAENGAKILIYPITKNGDTGLAKLAYERDTDQKLLEDKRYLGLISDLNFYLSRDMAETTFASRTNTVNIDGWGLDNVSPVKLAVAGKTLTIEDNGKDPLDFAFFRTLSPQITKDLRGQKVTVDLLMSSPADGFNLVMLKYAGQGTPNGERIASRKNEKIVYADGWTQMQDIPIAEKADGSFFAVKGEFIVPIDANIICFALVPLVAKNPLKLEVKQFDVNVKNPFYIIEEFPRTKGEMLEESEYVQYEMQKGNQQGLRYTANANYQPCPIGSLKFGTADITIDRSKNQIAGSQVTNDSGIFVFADDGEVIFTIEPKLGNEQNTDNQFSIALFNFNDPQEVEIADTEITTTVKANSAPTIYTMDKIVVPVKTGDSIGLKKKSDKPDGAFLETLDNDPLIRINIQYLSRTNP